MSQIDCLYMVSGCYFRSEDGCLGIRRVVPDPLALFSSAETAKAYVQSVSVRDMSRYKYEVGSWYEVSKVPFNPPENVYRLMLNESASAETVPTNKVSEVSRQSLYTPGAWDALYEESLFYDLRGAPFRYIDGEDADKMNGEHPTMPPKYRAGDLVVVHLGRTGGKPQSHMAVIRLIYTTTRGLVSEWGDDDLFGGSYSFVYFDGYTCMADWSVEGDIEPLEVELPIEAEILEVLARHYRGHLELPKEEIDYLLERNPFVSNIECFDFERYGRTESDVR